MRADRAPPRRDLGAARAVRIVPSRFPPIDLFERLVPPEDLDVLFALEALTNDRLRDAVGDLDLVPPGERVTGPGATVVMAAFTHIGRPGRFSDGGYGVYYAALDEDTAIAETVYHRARFLGETAEPPTEFEMRAYVGGIERPLEDIRGPRFAALRDADLASWPRCQAFAAARRAAAADGLVYRSARRRDGECIAAFRPKAVSRPRQGKHYRYVWDGARITAVLTVSEVRRFD